MREKESQMTTINDILGMSFQLKIQQFDRFVGINTKYKCNGRSDNETIFGTMNQFGIKRYCESAAKPHRNFVYFVAKRGNWFSSTTYWLYFLNSESCRIGNIFETKLRNFHPFFVRVCIFWITMCYFWLLLLKIKKKRKTKNCEYQSD